MENTLLTLFGQPLTRFGLSCALAALVGLVFCVPRLMRRSLGYGVWIRLCVCVLPLAWLFARLFYALAGWVMIPLEGIFDLNTGRDPLAVLYFWHGGYSLVGAILGAALGGKLAELWTRTEKGDLRDALAVGIPAAVLVERLCERGSGLGLGRFVTADWLIGTGLCPAVDGDLVHPVYLYEALVALILLIVMLVLSLRRREAQGGALLRIFLVLFGLTQVVFESLRADGHMVEHFVHVQQVYSICLAVGVMACWSVKAARKTGRHPALTVGWILTLAAVGVTIWAEFGVDRWGKPLLAYGVMIVCMAVIGVVAFDMKRISDK